MAEPAGWLTHDHDDLKTIELCVYARSLAQDRRVLEYCDRHGILIQTEVPTWGPDTSRAWEISQQRKSCRTASNNSGEMIARGPQSSLHFFLGTL